MILSHVIHVLHAWWRYRTCVSELSQLSDHELADIGLTRSGIPSVAWHTAQDCLRGAEAAQASRNDRSGDR